MISTELQNVGNPSQRIGSTFYEHFLLSLYCYLPSRHGQIPRERERECCSASISLTVHICTTRCKCIRTSRYIYQRKLTCSELVVIAYACCR